METNFSRQLDFFDPAKDDKWPITIIGNGGIGSPTAKISGSMGIGKLRLIDFDIVEEPNRPSQGYREQDVGKPKVQALKEIIGELAENCEVTAIMEEYINQPLSGIVVSAVDSIAARKKIWQIVRYNPLVPLFIDGRLAGKTLEIYTALPFQVESVNRYEKTLVGETTPLPCAQKGIIYVGYGIGAFIASQINKFLKEEYEQLYQEVILDFATMTLICNDSLEELTKKQMSV